MTTQTQTQTKTLTTDLVTLFDSLTPAELAAAKVADDAHTAYAKADAEALAALWALLASTPLTAENTAAFRAHKAAVAKAVALKPTGE